MPPHLIIPSHSLTLSSFIVSPLLAFIKQFLSLRIFPPSFSFSLFHKHTRTHSHTPTVQPPTVCRMCSGATRASGWEASITSLPTISLSADQRAAKQPETTAAAEAEHAQQHN